MDNKIIKLFILVILIVYVMAYMISSSGYYEYTMQQRTVITNEKIKEFEEDVKNRENIDLKDYLEEEEVDYSNRFSNLMYNISDSSNKITRKMIKYIFKKLSYLVED